MTTGAFTLVYAVGTAAALRLLPRGWVRRGAGVGFVATLGAAGAHRHPPAGPGAHRGGGAGVDGVASRTAASRASPGLIDAVSAAP